MPSILKMNFVSIPSIDESINLNTTYSGGLNEVFKAVRSAAGQSPINEISLAFTMQSYKRAFGVDYNFLGLFLVSTDGLQIIIEHPESGFWDENNIENLTNGSIVFDSITNSADIIPINISDITFSEASNPCTHIKMDVTTDVLATKITSNRGHSVNPNAENPFSLEFARGGSAGIQVENATGETSRTVIDLPQTLSANNATIETLNSPNGATITATVSEAYGLDLEYSLDDSTYQSENYFNSLIEGDYTLYIRDQFGCSMTKDFSVAAFEDEGSGVGRRTPYVSISKANSFRFAERVDFDLVLKTDENTLSYEAFAKNPRLAYKEVQQFLSKNSITTQIKTNYNDLSAVVIKEDGSEDDQAISQKTDWMALKDRRDAIKYNLENGQTGLYFTSGNTYDPDTEVQNGTYALNGGLPYWGTIGNYLFLDAGWYQIKNVIFDESKKAEILVIEMVYEGVEASVILNSVYDEQNYNVFEFETDLSIYNNSTIQVQINAADSVFETVTFLSEDINVKNVQEYTAEIKYKNASNSGIFYATGIENLINIPILKISGKIEDESETHKTDTRSVLLGAKIYEVDDFEFEPVTKEIMRKIVLALSHDDLVINGVSYVKNGASIEVEGALEDTNLYQIKATLIKSGVAYNSNGTQSDFSVQDIPAIIEGGSGEFIVYQ